MNEVKPQSRLSAIVPVALWLLPGFFGMLIAQVSRGDTVGNVVVFSLCALTWFGWISLCLKAPREPEANIPPVFVRMVVTLKLAVVVCAGATVTGIAFVCTVDYAALRNFSFLFDIPLYLVLAGFALGWNLLLVNAYHNRGRPQSILRCTIDTLDIGLAAVLIGVAGVTVLFVLDLTGLSLSPNVSAIAAMMVFGVLFLWRIGPYFLRGLLALKLCPRLTRWSAQ